MMIGPKEIGQALATSDDEVQARALNAFGFHLRMMCEDSLGYETQLCGVAKYLNKDGKNLVKALAEFAELDAKHGK